MSDTELSEPQEAIPEGWEHILSPGERILWQGRPSAHIIWSDLVSVQSAFGVVFTAFAVFWTSMASGMGVPRSAPGIFQLFPLFGLLFVAIGLYQVVGRIFWDAYVRANTHYSLTSKTAYVATSALGKRNLQSYRPGDSHPVELEDGDPGTVWFAEKVTHHAGGYRNGRYRGSRTSRRKIGFRQIADARRVFGLTRAVAEGREPEG